MKSYQQLSQRFARIAKLNQLNSIASWDEQVNMPVGAGASRAQVIAEVGLIVQELLLEPAVAELIQQAAGEELDLWQRANLAQMKKCFLNATAVPTDLNRAHTLAVMNASQLWRELRAKNDWQGFLPAFKEVVNLSRQQGEARGATFGLSTYDALLNIYQDGVTTDLIEQIFNQLKSWLPGLTQQVIAQQQDFLPANGPFALATQRELGLAVMHSLGFDFAHGRLDVAHHPFCGGVPSDVRLTTRYSESDFSQSLMGIIHETGHGKYEQGLPREWEFQPVGAAAGMMIHESQSLLFEMQVARSKAFITFLAGKVRHYFAASAELTTENLVKIYHQVKPGLIRVDADELTYPAHIILRYEIESELMAGKIKTEDIPELWDFKMQNYLGLSTAGNYKDGCMQDVHWPSGAFGYFPCYTLGAMLAAQLFDKIKAIHPQVEQMLSSGDTSLISQWLAENIWSKASLHNPLELVQQACGAGFSVAKFEQHLMRRYC